MTFTTIIVIIAAIQEQRKGKRKIFDENSIMKGLKKRLLEFSTMFFFSEPFPNKLEEIIIGIIGIVRYL